MYVNIIFGNTDPINLLHGEHSLICRYLAGSNVFSDFSCQKKLVCELYWESEDLGELGVRGAHGLDLALDSSGEVSKYVTLPRPVTNAIEEFKVRTVPLYP